MLKEPYKQPDLLYSQIEADLRNKILTRELTPGDRLPPEMELCDQYSVSRITVRKAIQILVDEGLVYRLRGRGTFVSKPKKVIEKSAPNNFGYQSFSEMGGKGSRRVIERKSATADKAMASRLETHEGAGISLVKRVIYEDSIPIAIDDVFVSSDLFPNFLDDLKEDMSLYQLLTETYKERIEREELIIDASIANEEEARLLSCIKGAPLFILNKVTRNAEGTPLHYSKSRIRADRMSFTFTIGQDGKLVYT